MASNAKRMWLHDESDTITVLPITTLDNVKIQPDKTQDNFIDFETDYNNTKTTIINNKNSTDAAIGELQSRITSLEAASASGATDVATITSDGLMSKEDKIKLNNIEEGANNYILPQATLSSLGGVKVDGLTTSIDDNGILHAASSGGGSIDTLTDTVISGLMDDQILQYDFVTGKWKNKTLDIGEVVFDYITQNQIDSLFPIDLVAFNTGTDEQIAAMINSYYNGELTLEDIQTVWSIGDTREIDIETIAATGGNGDNAWEVGETHRAQTITIQILDFEHDELTTPINGKTKALITVDLKRCLVSENLNEERYYTDFGSYSNTEIGYINSSQTNIGGWADCARRKWCNNGFYQALPNYIKSLVKPVDKLTSAGDQNSNIITTSDKIFLLSNIELINATNISFEGEGSVYSFYIDSNNRGKEPIYDNGNNSNYVSGNWWLRSPAKNGSTGFCFYWFNNTIMSSYASNAFNLAPAFCM